MHAIFTIAALCIAVVLQKELAVFHVTFLFPPFICLVGTPFKISFVHIISMCLEPEGSLIETFKKM